MREKIAKRIILIGIIAGVVGLIVYSFIAALHLGVQQGYEPDQPINFSHKIHAGENEIQCLYCHFGAEKSRHAGIPPANVCLNCHQKIKTDSPEIKKITTAIKENKPIQWVKVHNLPDFVYFNHSQHVLGGVSCQSCHGPVETMGRMRQAKPLTMGWCIDCHREKGITPPKGHGNTVPEELQMSNHPKAYVGGMDCAKCHY